jgi:hypothetical protein
MITYLDSVNWETLREAINLLLRLDEREYLEQPEYYVQKIRPSLPQRWGRSSLLTLTRGLGLAVGQHNIDLVLHLARSRKEYFMSPLSTTSLDSYPATEIIRFAR